MQRYSAWCTTAAVFTGTCCLQSSLSRHFFPLEGPAGEPDYCHPHHEFVYKEAFTTDLLFLLRLTALLGDRTQSQPYCTQMSTYVKEEVFTTGSARTADFATLRDCTRFPNLPSNIVMWIITGLHVCRLKSVVSMEFCGLLDV